MGKLLIRERIYETERETLCKYACLCENTRGRETPIEESPIRTEYMRDRDRIIHSKSWRRLKDKTQVFIAPSGAHYRTRLTHTMEVAQLARTIAKALRLNEDLTEAIALGHDLGHTPFGHMGERALARLLPFEHNIQSLRVVESLENGAGMNLTWEVRDGILNHRKSGRPATLEGMAVNISDRIAYLNHDIDDAVRAGMLTEAALPPECTRVLGDRYSARINTMISDIVENSLDKPVLAMTEPVAAATDDLRTFLFEKVYLNSIAEREEEKVDDIVKLLFGHFVENPQELPELYRNNIGRYGIERCAADHIAGMTDNYAIECFTQIFVPRRWKEA